MEWRKKHIGTEKCISFPTSISSFKTKRYLRELRVLSELCENEENFLVQVDFADCQLILHQMK